MNTELLPCPFCGTDDDIGVVAFGSSYCVLCACEGNGPFRRSPNSAIAAWNTRATQPQAPQGAEAERLREALVCTREALERANTMPGGPIIDTIWYDTSETLFDYIDSVLAAAPETPEGQKP